MFFKSKITALALAVSFSLSFAQTPLRPFGQTVNHGYAQTRVLPSNRTQAQMNQDVADQFNRILSRFIVDPTTNAAGNKNDFLMVLNHATGTGNVGDDGVTVCEAHGFGMVILAYMAGAEDMMVPSVPTNLNSAKVPLKQRLRDNLPAGLRSAFGADEVTIKHYFDACFRTMEKFPATNTKASEGKYLMAWQIRGRAGPWTTQGISMSTATDGALDMTYALLVADRQWGGPAHNKTNTNGGNALTTDSKYLYWSKGAMQQLWLTSVNRDLPSSSNANFTMNVGNWINGNNRRITRPSDFMITHWKSFSKVGNSANWNNVVNGTYKAINEVAHTTTGLLPDFLWFGTDNKWRPLGVSPSDGISHWNEGGANDARYHWNACRVPWRIGLDILHTGTGSGINSAVSRMNSSMNSRTGTRFSSIRGGPLSGELTGSSGRGFSAPYLVTAAAYGPQAWMTNGWDWARAINVNPDNYNCYIQVLSMIAASGNWWDPATPLTPQTSSIGASPTTLNFGSLTVEYATRPPAQTVTITNTGTTDITLSALPSAADYTLTQGSNWTAVTVAGASKTFTVRPNSGLLAGTYSRTITISGSNGTSAAVNVNFTVTPVEDIAPTITQQPENQSVTAGEKAIFVVDAEGRPEPTFQWQSRAGSSGAWSDIADETDVSLIILNANTPDNGKQFRVIVTNAAGSVTSVAAELTVTEYVSAPEITAHPLSKTVIAGQNATFTVEVRGIPTPSIQWQSRADAEDEWVNIADDANASSYTHINAQLSQNRMQFRALASNSVASDVESENATLTVNESNTAAENAAVGFVYLFTVPNNAGDWIGFNNAAEEASIEFDITVDADHTLTLPAWAEGGTGVLHGSHRDIYLLQPTQDANAGRKPVTLHSIKVNGTSVSTAMPEQSAAANRWLVPSTIGTVNPVTTVGANANNSANNRAFRAANLELRTFYPAENAFVIPTDAVVEITYRVGNGAPATSINKSVKSDSRYGIRFAQNIVSEKAEMTIILPNGERVSETKITIYDMTGNIVFVGAIAPNRPLIWNLINTAGRNVANGIYLVVAKVNDKNGNAYHYSAKLGVKR